MDTASAEIAPKIAPLGEGATPDSFVEERSSDIAWPSNPALLLQSLQFLLLVMVILYVARPIALPIVLAVMLKLLLQPAVRLLERLHLPRGLGAALIIAGIFAVIVGLVSVLSAPAQEWAQKLPGGIPRLQERLSFLSEPIERVSEFLQSADGIAHGGGTAGAAASAAPAPGPNLTQALFSGTANFATGFFTTLLVLFFLLVSGETFLRRFVEILPRFRDKRQAVVISQQIEADIAAYLLTITVMNAAVGLGTVAVAWACGLGTPVLWGVLIFLLNYVPLLGPTLSFCILLMAGLLTNDTLGASVVPAGAFLAMHLAEGQFATPMLVARRFTLNPVMVVVSLIFWYWMWGVPGAILAVPMLAMTKIICDGIRPWAALGHLIGG